MSLVLVAEDSPAIRLLFIRRLEAAGHQVITANDGAEALSVMRNTPDEAKPEIILLDAMMPGIGGAEALKGLKETDPEIPVLVVSAVTGLAHSPEWAEADGLFAKPIDFDFLLSQVERLTSGRPRP